MSDAAPDAPVLSLRGVRRTYTQGIERPLEVLRGVDLDLRPGEIVGLIGPSGSGKSSLLHAAGLLELPTAGRIVFAGEETTAMRDAGRTRLRLAAIGFVYQFHHLLPELTAVDNVAIPLRIAGRPLGEARARGRELLTRLGLGERLGHRPPQLSGGEQQRVACLIATHNLELAGYMDRVVSLRDGVLLEREPASAAARRH